jgi:hypothetical protein
MSVLFYWKYSDFKHLKLKDGNIHIYDAAGICTVIVNSNNFSETSCARIPTVVKNKGDFTFLLTSFLGAGIA